MKKLAHTFFFLIITSINYAQSGSLDSTFGVNGMIVPTITTSNDWCYSIAIQNDGKIILGGNSAGNFALTRYNDDGSLDATFGTSGVVSTLTGFSSSGSTILIQNDGKIILAGSLTGGIRKFAIARYNINGSLDYTFGSGGISIAAIGTGNSNALSAALQNDGKIVMAGDTKNGSYTDFALVRYNPNGTLDSTFSSIGIVTTAIGTNDDYAKSVTIQNDGKIVVTGNTYSSATSNDIAVARYNSDGSLDTSFGSGGFVITQIGTNVDEGSSIGIQNDGKIVVAGNTNNFPYGTVDCALVRYNTNGSLDTTFGSTGKIVTRVGASWDYATNLLVQGDGKLLICGAVNRVGGSDFVLVRYNSDGSLDNTLNSTGIVTTRIGNYGNIAYDVAIQNDNKIVAAGISYATASTDVNFAVSRYKNQILLSPCSAYYSATYDSTLNNFEVIVNDTAHTTDLTTGYRWNFGDGTSSTETSPSHTYLNDTLYTLCMTKYRASGDSCTYCHVIGIDSMGAIVRSGGFTINVINSNLFIQSPSICYGQSIVVGSHTYMTTGNYTDILTSQICNCDSTVVTHLTVNNTSGYVTVVGTTLNANETSASYQWINCSGNVPIPGETNQSFTPSSSGNYAVIVTKNGCSVTSSCYNISFVGVSESDFKTSIHVYPNPFNNQTTVSFDSDVKNVTIKIIDILGKEIKTYQFTGKQLIIEKDGLQEGIYFLQTLDQNGRTEMTKLIIQ